MRLLLNIIRLTTASAFSLPFFGSRLPGVSVTSATSSPAEYKYFLEPGTSDALGHYDARYFRAPIPYGTHRVALRHLIRSYLAAFDSLGVETWLAHGTLLGWWWNGRIMPWDYDLDVQVSSASLVYLGTHHNRTVYTYPLPYLDDTSTSTSTSTLKDADTHAKNKTYLLDINPFHSMRSRGRGMNVIDARWIDMDNGMFIDITGLRERDESRHPGVWSCKNWHRYGTRELWPMRETEFEGARTKVPYDFNQVLTAEYGVKALVATEWEGHRWENGVKEWVKIPDVAAILGT